LESLNARFNIAKLGVICRRYFRHYHGEMTGINAGIPTDRFEAEWWITSNRVDGRVVKQRPSLSLDALLSGGALLVNETTVNENGLSIPPQDFLRSPDSNLLLVEIPANYQVIKRRDFDLALRWRLHSRQLLEEYFQANFLVTDFVFHKDPEGRDRSYYLLTHGDS
jgi:predicted GNAT superfamily acetyltransferase